ncbi:hypothetical protein [Mycobacterium haemophilum]|uniref:hypothetical protein n=1 Tax=Mycobacterium haemophilum TaxID=29311 RepID=UPI00143B33E8|nr:hypothetical protein [Mycobacterium haemophilum]MCV7339293.1 hypothetical protein [Mycobacterium haemophilum DSM 44634]
MQQRSSEWSMQMPAVQRPFLAIHIGNQTYTVQQDRAPIIIGRNATAHVDIDYQQLSRNRMRLDHTPTGWVAIGQRCDSTFIDGSRQRRIPIKGPTTIYSGHPHGIA